MARFIYHMPEGLWRHLIAENITLTQKTLLRKIRTNYGMIFRHFREDGSIAFLVVDGKKFTIFTLRYSDPNLWTEPKFR